MPRKLTAAQLAVALSTLGPKSTKAADELVEDSSSITVPPSSRKRYRHLFDITPYLAEYDEAVTRYMDLSNDPPGMDREWGAPLYPPNDAPGKFASQFRYTCRVGGDTAAPEVDFRNIPSVAQTTRSAELRDLAQALMHLIRRRSRYLASRATGEKPNPEIMKAFTDHGQMLLDRQSRLRYFAERKNAPSAADLIDNSNNTTSTTEAGKNN